MSTALEILSEAARIAWTAYKARRLRRAYEALGRAADKAIAEAPALKAKLDQMDANLAALEARSKARVP